MLPGVSVTRQLGSLASSANLATKPLVVGPSSAGTANVLQTFSTPQAVVSGIGFGPASLLASMILADNGGSVDVIPASASLAGTVTSVTSGSGFPAVTVSGTPYDSYQFQASVTKAGALGAAQFQYSLDGGVTLSPAVVIQGTYPLANTGLTVTFPTASYSAGQSYSFSTSAPRMTATDLTNALNSFTGSASVPTLIAVANATTSSSEGLALAQAMDGALTTLRTTYEKPTLGIVPAGGADNSPATTIASFASFGSTFGNSLQVVAERARCQVPLPSNGYAFPLVPFAYFVADATAGQVPSTNPARVANGGLPRCSAPTYDEFTQGETYLDYQLGAPRTFMNLTGVYLNQGYLKSTPGSGYVYSQWGRVINLANVVLLRALKRYVNASVRVLKDGTGRIDPRDASVIEADVNQQLQAAIMQPNNAEGTKGYASGVEFSVDLTTNVLATSVLTSQCVLVPLANISEADVTLSFGTAITTT